MNILIYNIVIIEVISISMKIGILGIVVILGLGLITHSTLPVPPNPDDPESTTFTMGVKIEKALLKSNES